MKLQIAGKTFGIKRKLLEKVAEATFSFLPKKDGAIELKFVVEDEIRKLNHTYRGIDKATDVLSFEISDSPFLGQVFICYNKAMEQANDLNHSLEHEIGVLLVHGILHTFGYDHIDEDDYIKMKDLEGKINEKLGN